MCTLRIPNIWYGWTVKNLEALGEQSATGLDRPHGVYVINWAEHYSRLRNHLRNNDVISCAN